MCLVILNYAEGKDFTVPPLFPPSLTHYYACISKKVRCPEMNWTMSHFVKGSVDYHPYFFQLNIPSSGLAIVPQWHSLYF